MDTFQIPKDVLKLMVVTFGFIFHAHGDTLSTAIDDETVDERPIQVDPVAPPHHGLVVNTTMCECDGATHYSPRVNEECPRNALLKKLIEKYGLIVGAALGEHVDHY